MSRIAKAAPKRQTATSDAERVGTAEFRGNLAKYLKQAKAGTPVVIQERGRSAYVLSRFEEGPKASAFGCMRERTGYTAGAVVNATEPWTPGGMP
jgi:prevent-host-death family protein